MSRGGSVFAVFFLNFNPLYTYITFTGVVMKETSTYYLVFSFLLSWMTLRTREGGRGHLLCSLVLGTGVILGHHYAGLVVLLFTLSTSLQGALERLKTGVSTGNKEPYSPSGFAWVGSLYAVAFLSS